MKRIKNEFKNVIYSLGFLFRPIIPVAAGFVFLVLTGVLLVLVIVNLDMGTKLYEVLLAILTGITASLLISIMMELYNNYRFNIRRQRELREYFQQVSGYEIHQNAIMSTNPKYEEESILGNGRAYAVFCQLNKIIPKLKDTLNHRDYLYRIEIEYIDDILYNYNNLVKIIWVGLLDPYMKLISKDANKVEIENDEQVGNHEYGEDREEEGVDDEPIDDNESIIDYPGLYNFLTKEVDHYVERKDELDFYNKDSEYLESIIEKAIFFRRYVFDGYFEVTDTRFKSIKLDEENYEGKEKRFEFQSDMISMACGNIDKAMIKLQKRVAKEPYFWVMASYKGKN